MQTGRKLVCLLLSLENVPIAQNNLVKTYTLPLDG